MGVPKGEDILDNLSTHIPLPLSSLLVGEMLPNSSIYKKNMYKGYLSVFEKYYHIMSECEKRHL